MFSFQCLLIRDEVKFEMYCKPRAHTPCQSVKNHHIQIKALIHQHARSRISSIEDENQIVTYFNHLRRVAPVWAFLFSRWSSRVLRCYSDYCCILLLCFIDGFSSFLLFWWMEKLSYLGISGFSPLVTNSETTSTSPFAFDLGAERLNLMASNQIQFQVAKKCDAGIPFSKTN